MAEDIVEHELMSPMRLRVGVFFLILWWIPAWLLAPTIAASLGEANNSADVHHIVVVILIIQTVVGVLGLLVAGKQVFIVVRKSSIRKTPKILWKMLRSGKEL